MWVEVFLLLFGEAVFLGFGWLFCFEVAMLGRHTPPAPLERGVWDAVFFLVIRGLLCLFPLLIGDKGVCYGGRRGLG